MDEAGTSRQEPVTVVAGVMVDADRQWRTTEAAFQQVLDEHVPKYLREGFTFHAMEVYSGGKNIDRNRWPLRERLKLFSAVLHVMRALNLTVAIGITRRGQGYIPEKFAECPEKWDHVMAFNLMLGQADKFIRDRCGPDEVATVVAEAVPENQALFRNIPKIVRANPLDGRDLSIIPTEEERRTGVVRQSAEHKIERIVDCVHLVSKQDATFIQLADACAFTLRRFFAEQSNGDWLLHQLGVRIHLPDWAGPCSAGAVQLRSVEQMIIERMIRSVQDS